MGEPRKSYEVGGHTVSFERRRYGGSHPLTFTWAYVQKDGAWASLGDPWPVLRPKNAELLKAIQDLEERHAKA